MYRDELGAMGERRGVNAASTAEDPSGHTMDLLTKIGQVSFP